MAPWVARLGARAWDCRTRGVRAGRITAAATHVARWQAGFSRGVEVGGPSPHWSHWNDGDVSEKSFSKLSHMLHVWNIYQHLPHK